MKEKIKLDKTYETGEEKYLEHQSFLPQTRLLIS